MSSLAPTRTGAKPPASPDPPCPALTQSGDSPPVLRLETGATATLASLPSPATSDDICFVHHRDAYPHRMARSWYAGGSLRSLTRSTPASGDPPVWFKVRLVPKARADAEPPTEHLTISLKQLHGQHMVCSVPQSRFQRAGVPTRQAWRRLARRVVSSIDITTMRRDGYDGLLSPTLHSFPAHPITVAPPEPLPQPPKHNGFSLLPDELVQYLFTFAEDTDLQTMMYVSRRMRRLVTDLKFYRRSIMLERNGATVQRLLFGRGRTRPTREALVDSNILRGLPGLKRRMRSGDYVNTAAIRTTLEAQKMLRWCFLSRSVSAHLGRKNAVIEDLHRRRIIPEEAGPRRTHQTGGCSSLLLPQMQKLKMAFARDRVRRALSRRASWETVRATAPSEIVHAHMVTKPASYHPNLLGQAVALNRALKRNRLRRILDQRPELADMLELQLIHENGSITAAMLCPAVRPKIRYFEAIAASGGGESGCDAAVSSTSSDARLPPTPPRVS